MDIVNTGFMRVPINWVIVPVVVLLGFFGIHFLLSLIHGDSATATIKWHPSRLRTNS